MKQTKTGRVLAILILGILFGIYRHFTQMRWLTRGREAFLADQSRQFDRFTRYHSGVQMAIAGVIIASILFGL